MKFLKHIVGLAFAAASSMITSAKVSMQNINKPQTPPVNSKENVNPSKFSRPYSLNSMEHKISCRTTNQRKRRKAYRALIANGCA